MIQLYSGDRLVVGLSRANVDRLVGGLPVSLPLARPVTRLFLLFGEDKVAIIRELEKAGIAVPDAIKQSAEESPL